MLGSTKLDFDSTPWKENFLSPFGYTTKRSFACNPAPEQISRPHITHIHTPRHPKFWLLQTIIAYLTSAQLSAAPEDLAQETYSTRNWKAPVLMCFWQINEVGVVFKINILYFMRSLQHFYITTTILSSSAGFQANANRQYCQALTFEVYKLLHFSHQTKGLESHLRFQTSPFRRRDYEQGLRLWLQLRESSASQQAPWIFSYFHPHHTFPDKMLCFHVETAGIVMSRLWFNNTVFLSFCG